MSLFTPPRQSYYTSETGPVSINRRTRDVVITGSPRYYVTDRRQSQVSVGAPSVYSKYSTSRRYSAAPIHTTPLPRIVSTTGSPLVHYSNPYFPSTRRSYRSFYTANPYIYVPPSIDSKKAKPKKKLVKSTCGEFFDFLKCGSPARSHKSTTH
eukprot:Gregarina_sp_Poly_1__3590@NODE_2050_length_2764_cov_301_065999_g32_i2_p3_GENE_NODE_2050_length_2764_cov_301_065999_g32_i2NODE_2050_length_2764_cov_301_065999_g32_i2_p3_ORF_typecomplete_len153_score2_80_NODE_2050_length_2764_cov_301_065999_g32_i28881346